MLEIKESNPTKIGKLTKTIIDIKKTKSELTTNDLLRIRNKILKEGKKNINIVKFKLQKCYLTNGLHTQMKLNLMSTLIIWYLIQLNLTLLNKYSFMYILKINKI
jgi:hypothetical protein